MRTTGEQSFESMVMRSSVEAEEAAALGEVRANLELLSNPIQMFEALANELEAKSNNPEAISKVKTVRKKLNGKLKQLLPFVFLAFHEASAVAPRTAHFSERKSAAVQMVRDGITREQAARHIPGVSEMLYRGIDPVGYDLEEKVGEFRQNVIHGREVSTYTERSRNDAWRLYLGLPQENSTFGISEYKPSKGIDDKYYFKINNFLKDRYVFNQSLAHVKREDVEFKSGWEDETIDSIIKDIQLRVRLSHGTEKRAVLSDMESRIMGSYTLGISKDEKGTFIYYYDNWNLEASFEGENGLVGKPFEIYDRIYFDPVSHNTALTMFE